jgi:hypothetical protein
MALGCVSTHLLQPFSVGHLPQHCLPELAGALWVTAFQTCTHL